jgi:hypothetical protein
MPAGSTWSEKIVQHFVFNVRHQFDEHVGFSLLDKGLRVARR